MKKDLRFTPQSENRKNFGIIKLNSEMEPTSLDYIYRQWKEQGNGLNEFYDEN